MTPRPYQEEAICAALNFLKEKAGHPCLMAPTGSGKSLIIAEICRRIMQEDRAASVLILSHRKEILEQNAEKIRAVWPMAPIGIYSAGLNSKRMNRLTIAGIQSIAKKEIPKFDYVLIDECHLLPKSGEGQYRKLIEKLPDAKVMGFTATPYRLDSGLIVGEDNLFTDFCYEIEVKTLIDQGYLAPLVGKSSRVQADLSNVRKVGGEFVGSQMEAAMDRDDITINAIKEMIALGKDRKSWVVFASGVAHGEKVLNGLRTFGISSELITGETLPMIREKVLRDFKAGKIRALVNRDVLTTGFDAPCVDMIGLLRATASTSLYCQILGRGMRTFPGKKDCLILDYAGNLERHGPIDLITLPSVKAKKEGKGEAPAKTCPICRLVVALSTIECPECGYIWPIEEKIAPTAAEGEFLSVALPPTEHHVQKTEYFVRESKKTSIKMLHAKHVVGDLVDMIEHLCFEHEGFARKKAASWWRHRANDFIPSTCDEALARIHECKKTKTIWVKRENGFFRVVSAVLSDEHEKSLVEESAAILKFLAEGGQYEIY